MLPVEIPVALETTFETTLRLPTTCWNVAPEARFGTPIFATSVVNASIEVQMNFGPVSDVFRRSR